MGVMGKISRGCTSLFERDSKTCRHNLRAVSLFASILITLIFLGATHKVQATTVIPPDFNTLVSQAEIIFRGKVTKVRSEWTGEGNQRCIVTYITFDVLKVLKGKPSSPYELKVLGGTVGSDVMEIDDVPKFKVGDQTLLFVENNGTQFMPLVGIMNGYFRIETDAKTGNETVLRHSGKPLQKTDDIDQDHRRWTASGGAGGGEKEKMRSAGTPMKRRDFEDEIQRKLNSNP